MSDLENSQNPAENGLSRTVEITIPSKDRFGNQLPRRLKKKLLTETQIFMTERFGGATTFTGNGSVMMAGGRMEFEIINVISSKATGKALKMHKDEVFAMAKSIAAQASQESVAVTIDNVMDFVRSPVDVEEFVQPKSRWPIWLNSLLGAFKINRPDPEPV